MDNINSRTTTIKSSSSPAKLQETISDLDEFLPADGPITRERIESLPKQAADKIGADRLEKLAAFADKHKRVINIKRDTATDSTPDQKATTNSIPDQEVAEKADEHFSNISKVIIERFGLPEPQKVTPVRISGVPIMVKHRIPYADLIDCIEWCVNAVIDDRTFVSAPMAEIIEDIAIIRFFTNIDTSDIEKEYFDVNQFYKWYDILYQCNAMSIIRAEIHAEQLEFLSRTTKSTLTSIINYRNSASGLLDALIEKNKDGGEKLTAALQELSPQESESISSLLRGFSQFSNPT